MTTADLVLAADAALILIDIQAGFDDPSWGAPSPDAEAAAQRMQQLGRAWEASARPVVVVRHDSVSEGSPLHPGQPGNDLLGWVAALRRDVLVTKSVNSAFIGEPDLAGWLRGHGISQIVVIGIQTNMCVETTSRMGGNLGFDVIVPIDATSTFDLAGPDGEVVAAQDLIRVTAANLHGGGFATVTTTEQLLEIAR